MAYKTKNLLLFLGFTLLFFQCQTGDSGFEGTWEYESEEFSGTLVITKENGAYQGQMRSFVTGTNDLKDFKIVGNKLSGNFPKWGTDILVDATFLGDKLSGTFFIDEGAFPFSGGRFMDTSQPVDRSGVEYLLAEEDLAAYEKDIDHAGLIADFNEESFERGQRIFNGNCINCHGTPEVEGSIPLSLKFWEQPFKGGSDPYSMYLTLTKGFKTMPPQINMTPQEKYDVICYLREAYIQEGNPSQYFKVGPNYLASLPKGTSIGPASKPYHPWKDMDYGNFFINTYELADEDTGIPRFHSPGPTPFVDEDYSKNNFAYKGIAVRLDEGSGGVSEGNTFMIFDHDVMRVAGGWTGEGFIDWRAILLNDEHETYPRTVGKLHFETPVGPGWANPANGSFDDPRYTARDGRQFGPLPKKWADYKGLYHHDEHIILSYSIGKSNILEELGMDKVGGQTVFTRTLNISPSSSLLRMRVAPIGKKVAIAGNGATLKELDGFHVIDIQKSTAAKLKIFIADSTENGVQDLAKSAVPTDLRPFTKGGQTHYPQALTTNIIKGKAKGAFAVDELTPPFENPWKARMKLSGIDFMKDANVAVACATDGDIWKITGLTDESGQLTWRRIGSGLFQPLGIKVLNEKIYVTCRDQLVLLRDFNGDGETDFYESFNHDHQVTDHFHEFAMGLQADQAGNLYYAKSGRHAREALIPRHGTLIKVSKDGEKSEIVATGFRAANGVCINPDGSFIVTDQQGFWNPTNRINWVDVGGKAKFYGNMWGYNPPKDSSRSAMEQPLVWVDMDFDRSPSELLWVDSKAWGPLNGRLLSFSYGYGKIQIVLHEQVNGVKQGGVIDIPNIKFLTGVMRGRFNPADGQLYACGMSAWGTSQLMRGGGLYRIRYTGKPLTIPIALKANPQGVSLTFAQPLAAAAAQNIANFEVKTWDLKRTADYGSDRYNIRTLKLTEAALAADGKTVSLYLPEIAPVDVMTIEYHLTDTEGTEVKGTVQNTIHELGTQPLGMKLQDD
ncbi:MAG: DUF6797 domain-containing protein [Bacteroidota bacterium]